MTLDSTSTLLDLRGLKLLIVECTDPLASIDIPHLLQQTGDHLERQESLDGVVQFHIRRPQS